MQFAENGTCVQRFALRVQACPLCRRNKYCVLEQTVSVRL